MRSPFRATAAALAVGSVVVAGAARADDTADCVAAHEQGQLARRDGRFDRAREDFAACQRDVCPSVIRPRCAEFARELEAAQPTLVIVVRGADGSDPSDARVQVDGAPFAAVSAVALRLNPGKHALHVEATGYLPADKVVVLPESFRDMQETLMLERPPSAQAIAGAVTVTAPPRSALPWVFTVASGASLLAAGALSTAGWVVHGNLKSSCGATGCTEDQVGTLRVLWPASFVALGVGVASGALAGVLFATRSHGSAAAGTLLLVGRSLTTGISFQ